MGKQKERKLNKIPAILLLLLILAGSFTAALPVSAAADSGWVDEDGLTYYYDSRGVMATGLQTIDGKKYFFNDQGVKAAALGIDVSQFNYDIDWNRVAEQGIDFAIIRIGGRGWGSGNIYSDSSGLKNLKAARAAGLKIGVYFYSTAVKPSEAVNEAEYVAEVLNGMQLDYPVYFDTEWSGDYPDGRADGLTPNRQADLAKTFCERIERYGYQAGIYSNYNYLYYCINYSAVEQYSIWMASYTEKYADPEFKAPYNIWQFTSSGTLDGITTTVDFNAVFG